MPLRGIFFQKEQDMHFEGEKIVFSAADIERAKRTGIENMLLRADQYCSAFSIPYICDLFELSTELGLPAEDLARIRSRASMKYWCYYIKTGSGKFRKIEEPDFELRIVQNRILNHILRYYRISEHAAAYHKGASVKNNAMPHVGKRYLLKMDLSDFFGHITDSMLMDTVFSEQHFPYPVGRTLTDICTRNGSVPQGACTSPAISNIVMKGFDDRMGRWCSYRGISYTRYSDDLTFSSDEPLYPAYRKARRMLEEMGFGINDDKTHFITSAGRQQVTGLVVNDKLGIPADYRRRLRQEIYYVLKFGARDAFSRSDDCRNEPGMTLRRYLLRLIGKTEYVLQIRNDDRFFREAKIKLAEEIAKLSSAEE